MPQPRTWASFEVPIESTSLGGVESPASTPHNASHLSLTVEQREAAGIPAGMIRLSVGLEPADRLIADIRRALDRVFITAATGG